MTAWYISARRRRLRQLQDETTFNPVESYINDNQADYLNDDLLQVAYVGQRDTTTVPDPIVGGAKLVEIGGGADDGAMSPVPIGLVTGGALLVLMLLGAAWVGRRLRRREAAEELDAEGAFPGLNPESESNPNHYGTGDDDDHYEAGGKHHESNDEATQMSAPPLPENVRSDNLFRLDIPSDAQSLQSRDLASAAALGGRQAVSPSTPSDLSMSSLTTARQLDYFGDSQPFLKNAPAIVEAEDNCFFRRLTKGR